MPCKTCVNVVFLFFLFVPKNFVIFVKIRARIDIFTNLPLRSLDKLALQKRIDEIGRDPAKAS